MTRIEQFDNAHSNALRGIWLLGDVHGAFKHIAQALLAANEKPRWLVFLGDIDIDHIAFREVLAPMQRHFPAIKVAFIHGNHDADTYEHWDMLHDCGDAVALHGKVLDMDGVRVAGLGGNFMGRVWSPPGQASFANKVEAMKTGSGQWRDGDKPNPALHAAIYPDDLTALSKLRADILVTHEAPACHPHGFAELDDLARSMGVVRSFHGHHHDDRSAQYLLGIKKRGFDARGVGFCGVTNGLGKVVRLGDGVLDVYPVEDDW